MTEFKTLKDMKCQGETHGYRERWISETELKAEALKWAKENRKILESLKDIPSSYKGFQLIGQNRFIKHFFNLTEEELIE